MLMPMLALLIAAPGGGPAEASCDARLDLPTLVQCALAHNPQVQHARLELDALAGQRLHANTWLPSNPELQLTAGDRRPVRQQRGRHSVDWSASLAQEFEIGGQRWARLAQTDAATAAQVRRVLVTERAVTAATLAAAYDWGAAQQGNVLASQLSQVATQLAALAQARAAEHLLAPVDADVARAESVRMALAVLEAQRRVQVAEATLRILLGRDDNGAPVLSAAPLPLLPAPSSSVDLLAQALRRRGEVAAAQTETQVLEAQVSLLRRARLPNVTLSVFGNQDNRREWVLGGGLSLPIPLPNPVGQSRAGEIVETEARVQQAAAEVHQVQRAVAEEVAHALAAERTAAAQWALFDAEHAARAQQHLQALGDMLSARQMSLREALLSQRSLIELLQSQITTRLGLALARVELVRATGLPFFDMPFQGDT